MLAEVKKALRVTATAYDSELVSLIRAGLRDLEIAGITIDGALDFTTTDDGITDDSTIGDELIKRAIITYVRMHFGSPADYDRLAASYELQKVQLMHASDYTEYEGAG